jgi:hypothetical protein
VTHQHARELHKALRHAAARHQFAGEDEHRDCEQRERIDAGHQLLRDQRQRNGNRAEEREQHEIEHARKTHRVPELEPHREQRDEHDEHHGEHG